MTNYHKWLFVGIMNSVCVLAFFLENLFQDAGNIILNVWMIIFCFSEYCYLINYFEENFLEYKNLHKFWGIILINIFWILFNYIMKETDGSWFLWKLIGAGVCFSVASIIFYYKCILIWLIPREDYEKARQLAKEHIKNIRDTKIEKKIGFNDVQE
jgi:hypothetical protein